MTNDSGESLKPASQQAEATGSLGVGGIGDLLTLPPEQARLMSWIIRRRQATASDVAQQVEPSLSVEQWQALLKALVEQGLLVELEDQGETYYRPRLQRQPRVRAGSDFWQKLE
jgi:predicted transcriptional regulator